MVRPFEARVLVNVLRQHQHIFLLHVPGGSSSLVGPPRAICQNRSRGPIAAAQSCINRLTTTTNVPLLTFFNSNITSYTLTYTSFSKWPPNASPRLFRSSHPARSLWTRCMSSSYFPADPSFHMMECCENKYKYADRRNQTAYSRTPTTLSSPSRYGRRCARARREG